LPDDVVTKAGTVMTRISPHEFARRMANLSTNEDIERRHMIADDIIIELLKETDYYEGAELFEEMEKYYNRSENGQENDSPTASTSPPA